MQFQRQNRGHAQTRLGVLPAAPARHWRLCAESAAALPLLSEALRNHFGGDDTWFFGAVSYYRVFIEQDVSTINVQLPLDQYPTDDAAKVVSCGL